MRKIARRKLMVCFFVMVIWYTTISIVLEQKYVNQPRRCWIALYRILGNDLPPRHSSNQTLTNVLFILQNEAHFDDVTKIWLLNRIVDTDVEQALINLLNEYSQPYLRIPFQWDEYRRISYYIPSDYSADGYFNSTRFVSLKPIDRMPLIDILYNDKNLYVMNSNSARNYALRHGKRSTQAEWLMVFDGNCFLSEIAFDQIRQALLMNGSRIQYFLVPMIRLTNNSQMHALTGTEAKEEPQIIFRRDSTVEYLPSIRYGCGPKEELLVYLGAMKSLWRPFKWEPPGRKALLSFKNRTHNLFQYTSFLFRLYSGYDSTYEMNGTLRACSRSYGIFLFLNNLDRQIGQYYKTTTAWKESSHRCLPWSLEQIKHIIRTIRQIQGNILSSHFLLSKISPSPK